LIVHPIVHAQPVPLAPELRRAKDLYQSAEAAMKEGRFDDAARDYGAAYELSKDAALFWKIGHANEEAGRCDVALTYYARYLSEGHPSPQFVTTTQERIAACGGNLHSPAGSTGDAGSAGSAPRAEPPPIAGNQRTAPASTGSADTARASHPADPTEAPVGIAKSSATPVFLPSNRHKAAWLLTGGAIALVTLGGVLAYAAHSSENDVRDLYVGFAGQPATFDGQTQRRYGDLVDQGRRYEHLSWASFGLAGATMAGAAVLFVLGRRAEAPAQVTPIVTLTSAGAGVAGTF
jgi:tetratricopeptide (TPR) repeat protein